MFAFARGLINVAALRPNKSALQGTFCSQESSRRVEFGFRRLPRETQKRPVFRSQRGPIGCSGMWCFRMWCFKMLVLNPSPISALGVKSPHLQLLRVNKHTLFKPHILKRHIPELPIPGPTASPLLPRPCYREHRGGRCQGGLYIFGSVSRGSLHVRCKTVAKI